MEINPDEVNDVLKKVPQEVTTQVLVNTLELQNVKEDIHEIRADIKAFRLESREDAKSTRAAVLAFASAVSVPIILAAIKLLVS